LNSLSRPVAEARGPECRPGPADAAWHVCKVEDHQATAI
jgi:hypothetical protein